MTTTLDQHLSTLGFTAEERRVYLTLFKLGKTSARDIARGAEVPRTTTYLILKTLIDRGLVAEDRSRGKTHFGVLDPRALSRLVEKREEELRAQQLSANQLVEMLTPQFRGSQYRVPTVAWAEGKREVEKLLYRSEPLWKESYTRLGHPIMWGYQDHTFVEEYAAWHRQSWRTRFPEERICLFSNQEGVAQQQRDKISRREIRLLPAGVEFASSMWIHGEYILLGMTRTDPHRAILIHEPTLAANQRAIFQMLWKASEPRK